MQSKSMLVAVTVLALIFCIVVSRSVLSRDIVRPEEIKSKRQVIYDDESYKKLAHQWKDYYNEYPSEYAYANWMYAARYAGDKNYSKLLDEGVKKYPANPTILYLKGLEYCNMAQEAEGLDYLEEAVKLDPSYSDPWFALVTYYMESREDEKLDIALKNLLESGDIAEEIMDYNYNVLIGLEENAIIFTNGDNDTYPVWILKRILKIRPDVTIVNRSLLNTRWYPIYMIEKGLPRFIEKNELENLRDEIIKKGKFDSASPGGLYGDTLIKKIIASAKIAGRPVYLAKTMYIGKQLKELYENGRDLGLAVLVTESKSDLGDQLRRLYDVWLNKFRTGAMTGWRWQYAPESDAGNFIIPNYAFGIASNLESLKKYAPELRVGLFHWYKNNIENLLSEENKYRMAYAWSCYAPDIKEIDSWCKGQGVKCGESDKE